MKSILKYFSLMLLMSSMVGCASFNKKLKTFLNGDEPEKTKTAQTKPQEQMTTFSSNPNMPVNEDRQYHRMTKKQFEEQELFSDNAGSLWVMEGQDSYLFTQNIVRLPGDILNVVLDGQPEKQLSTKAQVIKELTDRLEKRQREIASAQSQQNANAQNSQQAGQANNQNKQQTATEAKPEENAEAGGAFDVKTVPTKIVERMSDGSYRVKGAQTFMIGAKEYKVIVTGLVKPSDIADDSISSSKMVDSRFDIVRYTKGKSL